MHITSISLTALILRHECGAGEPYPTGTRVTQMTILDYIAANPGCSGGEIAAALNTPTTAINAELRRLWRSGSVIRKER